MKARRGTRIKHESMGEYDAGTTKRTPNGKFLSWMGGRKRDKRETGGRRQG